MKSQTKQFVSMLAVVAILASSSVFADEQVESSGLTSIDQNTMGDVQIEDELPELPTSFVMENLNPEIFAGVYKDESGYHIQTNDQSAAKRAVSRMRGVDGNEFQYSDVQYSLSELRDAKQAILDGQDGL